MGLALGNLAFTVIVPGTMAGWVPWLVAGDRPTVPGAGFGVTAPFPAAGGVIYAWCVWDFAAFGRGTPAPIDAPRRLVEPGLYRWTRNPMYFGVLAIILGQAALFASAAVGLFALAVGACFHLFVVLYEERHLAEVFGVRYDAYRARVGRWLPGPR